MCTSTVAVAALFAIAFLKFIKVLYCGRGYQRETLQSFQSTRYWIDRIKHVQVAGGRPPELSPKIGGSKEGLQESTLPWSTSTSPPKAPARSKTSSLVKYIKFEGRRPYHMGRKFIGDALPNCAFRCLILNNMQQISKVVPDAVVWNVLYSAPTLAQQKPVGQRWIFTWDFEAQDHPWNWQWRGEGIDWTMSFSSRSDIFLPSFRIEKRLNVSFHPNDEGSTLGRLAPVATSKSMLLAWMASNCVGHRLNKFKDLAQHLPSSRVASFGQCARQAGYARKFPCKGDGSFGLYEIRLNKSYDAYQCMVKHWGQFKFYFAAENARCDGYITEKLQRAYVYGMVPVVLSGLSRKDTEAIAPSDSFIHIDDFSSAKALADHLLALDRDEVSYQRYFAWRRRREVFLDALSTSIDAYCTLCHWLHAGDRAPRSSLGSRVLKHWWLSKACRS